MKSILQNLDELLDHKSDLSEKLCQIGDSIVYKLVQWTKRLPFYLELPVEVHTRLLTHKWHELLVLTTSAYQAIHGQQKWTGVGNDGTGADFTQEVRPSPKCIYICKVAQKKAQFKIWIKSKRIDRSWRLIFLSLIVKLRRRNLSKNSIR